MNIEELARVLAAPDGKPAEIVVPGPGEVTCGYTSDLLSDVMANASPACALITIQAHRNTVAVASLIGISAIVICNAREVPDEMSGAARDEGIAVLRCAETQFEVSGRLWTALRA